MTKKIIWIWENDFNPCSLCESMAGEYDEKPSVEPPLHPNCECKLIRKEVEEETVKYDATGRMINPADSEKQEYINKYGDDVNLSLAKAMEKDFNFKKALAKTAFNEGGYKTADGIDKGGETKYGISQRAYPDEDIFNLSRERANYLFYRDYFKGPNIDKLPDGIRDNVFDNAVNQGQSTAIRNLQKAAGVNADGLLGEITLKKIRQMNMEKLKNNFKENVNNTYRKIIENDPKQKYYENGWMNRLNKY